jgi:hypothetical protein
VAGAGPTGRPGGESIDVDRKSDGDTLIPMVAYTTSDGERKMERRAHDDLELAVAAGKARIASGDLNADDAALIYDGRISLETGKLDAIIFPKTNMVGRCVY